MEPTLIEKATILTIIALIPTCIIAWEVIKYYRRKREDG